MRRRNQRKFKTTFQRVGDVVNCPFVITVVGGALIAMLSLYVQDIQAKSTIALERERSVNEQRQDLLVGFVGNFPSWIEMYDEKIALGIWLKKTMSPQGNAVFYDGRSYDQVLERYHKLLELMMGTPSGVSYCIIIAANYDLPIIQNTARALYEQLTSFATVVSQKQRNDEKEKLIQQFDILVELVSKENNLMRTGSIKGRS